MIKKVILLLITFLVPLNVFSAVGDEYEVSVRDTKEAPIKGTGGGIAGGSSNFYLTSTSGEKLEAYCIDPYMNNPTSSTGPYTEIDPGVGRSSAAYKSIFEETCGAENEALRQAGLKTASVALGETSGRATAPGDEANLDNKLEKIYTDAANGKGSYNDGTGKDISDLQNLVNNAKNAKSGGTGEGISVQVISKDEGRVVIAVNYSGSVIKNITCTGNNASCSESGSSEGSKTYIITSNSCPGSFGASIHVSYEYGEDKDGDGVVDEGSAKEPSTTGSSCTCTPRFFEKQVCDASGCHVQQLIACPPESSPSGGAAGNDINGDGVDDTGHVPGEPYEFFWDDVFDCADDDTDECIPYSSQLSSSTEGMYFCDADGTTILEIDELLHEEYDDIGDCLFADGKDLAGAEVIASALIFFGDPGRDGDIPKGKLNGHSGYDKKMCDVYCSEDYKLVLPGPDANKGMDEEVFINSGTFFTIEGDMYDTTTVKCYGDVRYDVLVNIIDYYRNATVKAYNEYQKQLITEGDSECIAYTDYSECPGGYDEERNCLEYGEDYKPVFKESGKSKYKTYNFKWPEEYKSGEIQDGPNATVTMSSTEDEAACQSAISAKKSEYANKKAELDKAITEANKEIPEANKFWNDTCLKWNYTKINPKIYTKDNTAEIEFYYHDGDLYYENPPIVVDGNPDYEGANSTPKLEDKEQRQPKVGICLTENCNDGNKLGEKVDDGSYNHSEEKVTINYKFENEWCNPYDGSDPYLSSSCSEGMKLVGFPVSFETTQGKYPYTYYFSGIGHFFDRVETGRLEGVTNAYFHTDEESFRDTCVYNVNGCTICSVQCLDPMNIDGSTSCNLPFYECNYGCKVACAGGGCLLDFNTGFLVTYRTISLNNPFPTNITFLSSSPASLLALGIPSSPVSSTKKFTGSNWSEFNPKGSYARNKLDDGEDIYAEEPEYAITLTPALIQEIKNNPLANGYASQEGLNYTGDGEYATVDSAFVAEYFGRSGNIINSPDIKWPEWSTHKNTAFVGPAWK